MKTRIEQQFDFILEIDKEKQIKRETLCTNKTQLEDDAQHAWHMSIMALLLKEYASEEIDILKTISMLLIHDIVEIDAGDTYAYDEIAIQSQADREEKAANRLFGLLPEDQRYKFIDLFHEFEDGISPEARFAKALDNIQPMMLNAATDGKKWKEHQVKLSQILKRNQNTDQTSPVLWNYTYQNFIEPHIELGNIQEDIKKAE